MANKPVYVLRALTAVIQNTLFRPRGIGATLVGNVNVPPPYAALVLSDKPVSYNRLSEGMGTVALDYTGHSHDGVLFGGITPGVANAIAGDPGTAMFFDGTGYIDTPSLAVPSNFTVEAWGYTTSTASQCIMGQVDGGFNQGAVFFRINDSSGFTTVLNNYVLTTSTPAVSTYTWHHLVLTYNGAFLTVYVDGVATASAASGIPQTLATDAIIGRAGNFNGNYWNGALEEVAFYDYALSAVQVAAHNAAGRVPQQKNQPDTAPYVFGTLNTTLATANLEAAAGVNTAHIHIGWDVAEPTEGVFSGAYLYTIQQSVLEFKAQGMQVVLGVELHQPPGWAFAYADSHYINQFGGQANQINLIFNQVLRTKANALFAQINTAVGLNNFSAIRITGGGDAECLFPTEDNDGVHTNGYWAYDANALNGPNLPSTIGANPQPTFIPGGAFTTGQAQTWYDWYLSALVDVVNWQIQQCKTLGFTGQFQVLTPGLGSRPDEYTGAINAVLSASSGWDNNGTMGRGAVWDKFYAALPDKVNMVAYCSSMADGSGAPADNVSQPSDNSVAITDTQIDLWSSARWIRYISNLYRLPMSGENAGGLVQFSTMQMVAAQMRAGGMQGMYWAHDDTFYDTVASSTLAQYSTIIHQYNWGPRPKIVMRGITGVLLNRAYEMRSLGATLAGITKSKNMATRLLLLAVASLDLSTRIRLLAVSSKNLASRLLLLAAATKDIASRVRLLAVAQLDLKARILLLALAQKDLAFRTKLLATSLKNLSSRLKLLAVGTKDLSSRLRLAIPPQLSLATRTKLLAVALKDLASRVRVQVTTSRDLASRVVLAAVAQKDLKSRMRLLAVTLKDLGTRLRLAIPPKLDLASRVRLLAVTLKDTATRTHLLATAQKDLSTRTKLLSVKVVDIASRLKLQTVGLVTKDLASRLRLLSVGTKNLSSRTRLLAVAARDLSLRLRLAIPPKLDLSVRVRLLAVALKDVSSRTKLAAVQGKDAASRVRLLAVSAANNLASRTRLLAIQAKDQGSRIRLLAVIGKDSSLRVKLLAIKLSDATSRVRVLSTTLRDTATRMKLLAASGKDLRTRLVLSITGAQRKLDCALRLHLYDNTLTFSVLTTRDGTAALVTRDGAGTLTTR